MAVRKLLDPQTATNATDPAPAAQADRALVRLAAAAERVAVLSRATLDAVDLAPAGPDWWAIHATLREVARPVLIVQTSADALVQACTYAVVRISPRA